MRLDHFWQSQPKKLVWEQLRYIATAIRAEGTLRNHMHYMNEHCKEMRAAMDRALVASQGHPDDPTDESSNTKPAKAIEDEDDKELDVE